jgi:hypothetical protein
VLAGLRCAAEMPHVAFFRAVGRRNREIGAAVNTEHSLLFHAGTRCLHRRGELQRDRHKVDFACMLRIDLYVFVA